MLDVFRSCIVTLAKPLNSFVRAETPRQIVSENNLIVKNVYPFVVNLSTRSQQMKAKDPAVSLCPVNRDSVAFQIGSPVVERSKECHERLDCGTELPLIVICYFREIQIVDDDSDLGR